MASMASQLIEEVTVHAQIDSLEDVREICADGTYFPNNLRTFAEFNQQDATFHNLFISVRRCTCFRRVFPPSSGAQNCTYSVRYLSDQCLTLYVQF